MTISRLRTAMLIAVSVFLSLLGSAVGGAGLLSWIVKLPVGIRDIFGLIALDGRWVSALFIPIVGLSMHRSLLQLVCFLYFLSILSLASAGEDRSLEMSRLEIAKAISLVLQSEPSCNPGARCDPTDNLFVSPSRFGIRVDVYGVQDYRVAARISERAVELGATLPIGKVLELEVFVSSKREDLNRGFLQKQKILLELAIQGGRNADNSTNR